MTQLMTKTECFTFNEPNREHEDGSFDWDAGCEYVSIDIHTKGGRVPQHVIIYTDLDTATQGFKVLAKTIAADMLALDAYLNGNDDLNKKEEEE